MKQHEDLSDAMGSRTGWLLGVAPDREEGAESLYAPTCESLACCCPKKGGRVTVGEDARVNPGVR